MSTRPDLQRLGRHDAWDGVRAVVTRTGGVGDVDCDDACESTSSDVVTITVVSGVGDVDVETATEHD